MSFFDRLFSAVPNRSVFTRCLEQIQPKSVVKGSFIIELALWLSAFVWLPLIVLGMVYTLWRVFSWHKACLRCGSNELVPLNSERARPLMNSGG